MPTWPPRRLIALWIGSAVLVLVLRLAPDPTCSTAPPVICGGTLLGSRGAFYLWLALAVPLFVATWRWFSSWL